MSAEVLEAQQQLDRARDNLRSVEEGIKRTTTSNMRFRRDGGGGRGRPGRGRLAGRIAGVPRFREDNDDGEDEPPFKKSLSSVASRLGPINIEMKPKNDEEEEDLPTVKSTVTLSNTQDRDMASSIVNDSTNLNRSKRLFGSLLMGTLRQFKQDKEKNKTVETKQAGMWEKVDKKEAEHEAQTAADRKRLEAAKDGVNNEIKLLEEKIELAEMKVRAEEERDMYTGFIKTRSKPSIYYLPKEHNDKTTKTLHESQERVKQLYQDRIEGYDDKITEIEEKVDKSGGGVEKHLGELSTIKLESITKTIRTDVTEPIGDGNVEEENDEKSAHPETGIKVEVRLRHIVHSGSDEEQETGDKSSVVKNDNSLVITINKSPAKKISRSPTISRESEKTPDKSELSPSKLDKSPKRDESPTEKVKKPFEKMDESPAETKKSSVKNDNTPIKRTISASRKRSPDRKSPKRKRRGRPRLSPPKRKSVSPRRNSRSPKRNPRSPRRRSRRSKSPISSPKPRSPKKSSRSPNRREKSRSPKSRSPKTLNKENGKTSDHEKPGPIKSEKNISASSNRNSKSRSKSSGNSSASDSGESQS